MFGPKEMNPEMTVMSDNPQAVIVAIDPGRARVGLAVLARSGEIRHKTIVERSVLKSELSNIVGEYSPDTIVIGSGTGATRLAEEIVSHVDDEVEIKFVDEKGSTEEAVKLYYRQEKGAMLRFLSRIISWRPSRPLDDYAAVILGRRYLNRE